jgi:hypothetical protein
MRESMKMWAFSVVNERSNENAHISTWMMGEFTLMHLPTSISYRLKKGTQNLIMNHPYNKTPNRKKQALTLITVPNVPQKGI